MKTKAVFLDRDGTVITDVGYASDPDAVELIEGAGKALARIQERGFQLVLISNQSGIGRGWMKVQDLALVHARVEKLLSPYGVRLAGAFYCHHAPNDGCDCRKPAPGLLLDAAKELNICLRDSFMVGDQISDVQAGRSAGCKTILLVGTPLESPGSEQADHVSMSWNDIRSLIIGESDVL